jgi:D-3-phosphoglycerate dehydrogenase / 2-oxoglutarate reductase
MSGTNAKSVVIVDYDYGDVDIERAIIEGAGLELTAAHCKTEDEVIDVARNADAIIAQYVTVGAKAIGAFTRCRVIARYGTGVDIVDVDAATRHGILVTNVPNDWCENEVADHAMALLLGCVAACSDCCRSGRSRRRSPCGRAGSACASSRMTRTCPHRISPRAAPRRCPSMSCWSRPTTW